MRPIDHYFKYIKQACVMFMQGNTTVARITFHLPTPLQN